MHIFIKTFFLGLILFNVQLAQANQKKPLPSPDKTVVYKKLGNTELKLHFFMPDLGINGGTGAPKPAAIIFFFGGGWNSGSPSQFYRQSKYLASRGIVAISAEYRVKNRNKTTPVESVKDAKSAMRWLKKHAAEFNFDPKKIVAAGGSAGGHLAAATATLSKFNEASDDLTISPMPSALILFNAVIDNSKTGYGYKRVKDYWQDFSPLHNIHQNMPPTLSMIGTKDHLIPVQTAQLFQQKMHEVGIRSDLNIYEGGKHGFFNYQFRPFFNATLQATDKFLVSLGYLPAK